MFLFSATSPENELNYFLRTNALWIALSFAALIVVTLAIIFILYFCQRNKTKKKEAATLLAKQESDVATFIAALGGADNVEESSLKGSRLTVKLKDYSLFNSDEIKKCQVESVIKMSEKIILVSKIAKDLYAAITVNNDRNV